METAGSCLLQPQTLIWSRDLAFARTSTIPLTW